MKKILLSVAFMMSVCFFAGAQETQKVEKSTETLTTQVQDDYKEVKLENLNQNVQAAIQVYSQTSTIKKLEYAAAQKLTKITLIQKSDNSEKVVILDDAGKEVPAKA